MLADHASLGYTDEELEYLASSKFARKSLVKPRYWPSEIYSFGKCIRELTGYPSIFPLYVYSDHGVHTRHKLQPHELSNSARVHLTWSPLRAEHNKSIAGREVILIEHPWTGYRKARSYSPSPEKSGTLVFFSHHVPGYRYKNFDIDAYFEELASLEQKYHPIVICLHMHDIAAGHHKSLRKYGYPLVTAGNTLSRDFVDEFYRLVRQFAFATSQGWGSQTAYCIEMGIPYFMFGDKPGLINMSSREFPKGDVAPNALFEEKADRLFKPRTDSPTAEQLEFVSYYLGLNGGMKKDQLGEIIWREFFRSWQQWHHVPLNPIKSMLKKVMST
jgi:hypothetical protein